MHATLPLLVDTDFPHLDLTGGAPQLNPHFRYLAQAARSLGVRVTDRCNLTILEEPGQEDLATFLAGQGVAIIASLPCYLEENVDAQRGNQVFVRSIRALRRLNTLGYGTGDPERRLSLVYNPRGPQLPPPQQALEQDYVRHLHERYGVRFDRLLTLGKGMPTIATSTRCCSCRCAGRIGPGPMSVTWPVRTWKAIPS